MSNSHLKTRRLERPNEGFSLVMVMSIGLIGLMGSMAVTSMLFSGKRYSDQAQISGRALHNAEIAANYAIQTIQQAYSEGNISGLSNTIALPASLQSIAENPQQTLINQSTQGYTESIAFSSSDSRFTSRPEIRQIVARSTVGGARKQVTMLVAFYAGNSLTSNPASNQNNDKSRLDFTNALKANGKLSLDNVKFIVDTNNQNWDIPLLVSNSQFTGTQLPSDGIPGSVSVYNPNANNNVPTLDLPENAKIQGNLAYNGDTQGFTPNRDVNVLGNNIQGDGIAVVNSNLTGPTLSTSLPPQTATEAANIAYPPVQPGSSANLSNLIIYSPTTPSSIAQLPSINTVPSANTNQTSTTITIKPGQYITDSISLGNGGSVIVDGNVQVFLQNTNQNTSPFSFDGKLSFADATSNLNILYSGNQAINIDLAKMGLQNFKGQIYAPNSNISINLAGGTFEGAIVANALNVSNGTINFNPSSLKISSTIPTQKLSWTEASSW
jgi:hypothetical protein